VNYAGRVWVAMRLARNVDDCDALLRGEPVDVACLDPLGLSWALQLRFVRLDATAIELFFAEAEALEGAGFVA
jgi:hypothetical protein